MNLLLSLIYTFAHRPYILAFLLAFFVIGFLNIGLKRTLLFLAIAYTFALLSEACSIRTGFPYGWYEYLYDAMPGELMVWGVPVWDSLSYVFMTFASWRMANWVTNCAGPVSGVSSASLGRLASITTGRQSDYVSQRTDRPRHPHPSPVAPTILYTAIFTVLLDLLADPLALRGDQWFLGKIYRYPVDGFYFGIPLSNFIGWFFVAAGIIFVFLYVAGGERGLPHEKTAWPKPTGSDGGEAGPTLRGVPPRQAPPQKMLATGPADILGPLLYLSLILFNLILTLWIGEFRIALTGAGLVVTTFTLVFVLSTRCHQKK